jgi:hypothetical protein
MFGWSIIWCRYADIGKKAPGREDLCRVLVYKTGLVVNPYKKGERKT